MVQGTERKVPLQFEWVEDLYLDEQLEKIAQFERDLLSERVKSGLAAARARGKKLGRQHGQRPKSDKLAPKVIQAVEDGRSYRWIARDLGISKNTVLDIMKRRRQKSL